MLTAMFDGMIGRFLRPFWRPTPYRDVSQQVYGAVMAQSREPAFYLDYGVPDSVTGRFDMLCLHLFLLSNRLARETDPKARALGQEVFDRFAADVDHALREIGVGDTTVPKRKKQLIHGFYGQIEDFGRALDAGDADTLARKASERFSKQAATVQAARLARYMIVTRDHLLATSFDDIVAGRLDWPEPEGAH
jgi:cytochrome b pre-mRNA-processing protein 3